MNSKIDVFEKLPVPKAVLTLAVPTVFSMLVTVIYNMVDVYFVGQTGDPNQVAAVSLATPVFLLLMAFGNIFGIGGSSMISRMLGQDRKDMVKHVSSFCFWGALGIGVVMIAVFLCGMPFILQMIGSSSNTAGYAEEYLFWIGVGAPFVVLATAFSNVVRGEGASKASMVGMMAGTVLNIVLDPVMILWMGMGVAGAAIATIVGNLLTVIIYLVYILKGRSLLSIDPKEFRLGSGILTGVLAIGLPASLNNVLMSASNVIMNNFLASYGDIPVASMGVAMKANMLVVMLQIGIATGVQPLIGYSYGAANFKRMKSVIRFSMLCTVIIGTLLTAVYFFASDSIIRIFISDAAVVENGIPMLRALMLAGPVLGILFVFTNAFQAMGKAVPSMVLSISRQGLIFIPILFLGNYLAGLNGIIYAQPIADLASILMAAGIFLFINRRLKGKESQKVELELRPAEAGCEL